ncbi:D-alanyl-D-alanine carboxypeptidase family protein [Desulforudis sp. 1088]|uniref:D-alanyl-D-alanine carboxypeptidase family protein n=1 Tax=unclassified Candidatus Desulforudis TaxID=2635950 RepID=UPI003CE4DEF4
MRRRLIAMFVALIMVLCNFSPAFAETASSSKAASKAVLETTAESAVLMENSSGKVLFAKEPTKRLPIASVAKIMVLLLACEALDAGQVRLEDMIRASENAAGMGGSQIFLAPQEELSYREMLISIATGSANDACVAVAEHLAGSEEAFVEKMNEKVRELGLKNTCYVNVTGLPAEGHYSCAYDQAVILREALKNRAFREISRIKEYDLRGGSFKLWNTNKLLWWYRGTIAGKTGWTNEAKYCLASTVERESLNLIAVVLGTPEPKSHFRESIKLYNWGFARFKAVSFAKEGEVIKTVPVEKGTVEAVQLVPERDVSVVVPRGEDKDISSRIEIPEVLTAPLQKGEPVGRYTVAKKGEELLVVRIVTKNEVPKASIVEQLRKLGNTIVR